MLTEVDIVTSVVAAEKEKSSDEEEVMEASKAKLSTLRTYIGALIAYSTYNQLPEMAHHYGNLRMIRELIIKEQHMEVTKPKLADSLILVVLFNVVLLLVISHLFWVHLMPLKIALMLNHVVVSA